MIVKEWAVRRPPEIDATDWRADVIDAAEDTAVALADERRQPLTLWAEDSPADPNVLTFRLYDVDRVTCAPTEFTLGIAEGKLKRFYPGVFLR